MYLSSRKKLNGLVTIYEGAKILLAIGNYLRD